MRNKVSELMDGELDSVDATKIIDAVSSDNNMFRDWEVYHAIGDSLRQSAVNIDISEKVRNRLADEPLLLAPYPHKTHQNHKQKLLSLSVAASVVVFSAGWLVSQSVVQHETTPKEVYVTERANEKAMSAGWRRPFATFQPVSSYSSPSVPVSSGYHGDPLIYRTYREPIHERPVHHPSAVTPLSTEAAAEQLVTP